MNISVDAGALCVKKRKRFGNFTFTINCLTALAKYDLTNTYTAYGFCPLPSDVHLSKRIRFRILRPSPLWLSTRVGLEEVFRPKDIFLAFNQAITIFGKSKIISFSHGLSYHFFPELYPDSTDAMHDQISTMIKKSAFIVVSSKKVKKELLKMYSDYPNFKSVSYGIPYDMLKYTPTKRKKYFLYVGMNHPIKNVPFVIKAFLAFSKKIPGYSLYLVGDLDHYENMTDRIFVQNSIGRDDLKDLYAQATGFLTASLYESFNLPILEALSQRCHVIGLESAVIPELEPFTKTATNLNEFVTNMTDAAIGKLPDIDIKHLRNKFSWRKYTEKLMEFYTL